MSMPRMVSLLVVTMAVVYADNSFSPVDQAVWIDRLNYFRTTGLPWSAANMQRIGWKSDLAKTAASSAAKCSATTAPGVNVYQSSSSKSSSIIDEAIQQWVVETSKKTLRTLAQPGASGVEIGKGTYNSYSQIVWASTTSVGCASASCSGGEMVVCQFSPPGNDGSSAWYVHADPASKCPSGTTALQGLCVDKGDAANKQIAPIPAGKLTYEVYPAYVANMQTVLVEAARGIATGEKPPTVPPATTAAPTATTATPTSSSSKTPLKTPSKRPSVSSKKDVGGIKTNATEETPSSSILDNSGLEASSPSTKTGKASTSKIDRTSTHSSMRTSTNKESSTTKLLPGEDLVSGTVKASSDDGPSTEIGKASTYKTSTHSSMGTSTDKKSSTTKLLPGEDLVPGTVKASSDDGSTFTNEETSTKNSTSSSPASAPSTDNDESHTASTPMSGLGTVTGTHYKALGSGISVAGMAGLIVLAIVGVAAFGVVMSYKRNQRRQREIMRDGGIWAN